MSTGLLVLSLAIGVPGTANLQKGDAFTYQGTVVEQDFSYGRQLRREHELTLRVFVLDQRETWADAAVLTRLHRLQDVVGAQSRPITGAGIDKNAPALVHLDLVRIHSDGTMHLLLPTEPRLRLTAETPAQAVRPIPLDVFATSELGVFPPHPPQGLAAGEPWNIAVGNRPPEVWRLKNLEFINAEQCRWLNMTQQSEDWDKPIGGQRSWHREDDVWVSTEDGTARRINRIIVQREGISTITPDKKIEFTLAKKIAVRYELKERAKWDGEGFKRTFRDIEVAYTTQQEAPSIVRDAARLGPRLIEEKLARLTAYLDESQPGTSYREAILATRRTLEAARRGEVTATLMKPLSPAQEAVRSLWPEVGQPAPLFQTGALQLNQTRGQPVVLVFFKPASETTDLSLAIADAIHTRYHSSVRVLPLVVGNLASANKDRDRLLLRVPLYDGATAAAAYGVDTFPRFVLLGADGRVSWTFTGVGAETGFLLREQLDRLNPATLPGHPPGITPAPGATTAPPAARP